MFRLNIGYDIFNDFIIMYELQYGIRIYYSPERNMILC